MNKKREEHIVRVALIQAGVKITEGVNRAIADSLKNIRREKYYQRTAIRLLHGGITEIDKAAAKMGMTREELVLFYQDACPAYGQKLNRLLKE